MPLFFGTGTASASLMQQIQRFAQTPYPILLSGPTGSGKTKIARLIGALSARRDRPFVTLPLTGVPEELRHTELFGSTRGAFTGATNDRVGAVEAAHGGTLFLDELGHASTAVQQSLLTILDEGAVRRVGETSQRTVDVRFVFASAAELEPLVARGRFLAELYYRVSTLTIRVPSLAERRYDILALAHRFIARSLCELGKSFAVSLTGPLRECLHNAPWPGNVRQLQSICQHLAVALDDDRPLCVDDLPPEFRAAQGVGEDATLEARAVRMVERCGGNKSRAAERLGMSRTRLYRVLQDAARRDRDDATAMTG